MDDDGEFLKQPREYKAAEFIVGGASRSIFESFVSELREMRDSEHGIGNALQQLAILCENAQGVHLSVIRDLDESDTGSELRGEVIDFPARKYGLLSREVSRGIRTDRPVVLVHPDKEHAMTEVCIRESFLRRPGSGVDALAEAFGYWGKIMMEKLHPDRCTSGTDWKYEFEAYLSARESMTRW